MHVGILFWISIACARRIRLQIYPHECTLFIWNGIILDVGCSPEWSIRLSCFISTAAESCHNYFSPATISTITTKVQNPRRPPTYKCMSNCSLERRFTFQLPPPPPPPRWLHAFQLVTAPRGLYNVALAALPGSWSNVTSGSVKHPPLPAMLCPGCIAHSSDELHQRYGTKLLAS